jgi:hypothetical protein
LLSNNYASFCIQAYKKDLRKIPQVLISIVSIGDGPCSLLLGTVLQNVRLGTHLPSSLKHFPFPEPVCGASRDERTAKIERIIKPYGLSAKGTGTFIPHKLLMKVGMANDNRDAG